METLIACIPPEQTPVSEADQGSVVIVEDPYIRKYVRDVLGRHGHRAIGSEAAAATEMLRSGAQKIDLVITNSPRDFLDFADTVPLLYMAGVPDLELAALFSRCRVLQKPFHPAQLLAFVKDLGGTV